MRQAPWFRNLPPSSDMEAGNRTFKCRCGRCAGRHFSITAQSLKQATYIYGMLTLDDVSASVERNERHVYRALARNAAASIIWTRTP